MNVQVKEVMKERYGKVVLIGVILIALYYIFVIQSGISNWHSEQQYYQSEEFVQLYNEDPESYARDWDNETPIPYDSIEHYIKDQSYLYDSYPLGSQLVTDIDKSQKTLDYETGYSSMTMFENAQIFLVIFFFIGFLLFFIDLKTNFNTFLFSLGTTRTQIFKEKLKAVALPLFGILLVGKLAFIASIYIFIPNQFVNIQLSTLLLTALYGYVATFFFFAWGMFIGTLSGNLIFGSGMALAFISSLIFLGPPVIMQLTYVKDNFHYHNDYVTPSTYFSLNFDIDKYSPTAIVYLFFLAIGVILLFASWRAYQHISLENSSQTILVDKYRLPITLLITAYSCFIIWSLNYSAALTILPGKPRYVSYFISRIIISGLIIGLVTYGMVYFVPIKNKIRGWREKRRQAKGLSIGE
ncbi:hypothetical protein BAU15_07610 [Enterococcus sp. JM4C]|uniref:SoxR reducing system RseC family protein n=1 Tax=Candidatus Enterococcus huntleyi TaxID=1857217 RepID=UPI00137AB52E|nr:SoxR reducing system RseC family protein [Enterococcus sp. JM4C]KAF1297569.1 hypothetical protein BAU15_07610 [Enterococcus sp. JM4C]